MDSAENYPSYKRKEEFKLPEIYPSLVQLLLMYIGAMDVIFGVVVLGVALQKSLFNAMIFLMVLLSLVGGISCLKVAKAPDSYKNNNILKVGFGIGLIMGALYFYVIIMALGRV